MKLLIFSGIVLLVVIATFTHAQESQESHGIWDGIKETFSDVNDKIKQAAKSGIESAKNTAHEAKENIENAYEHLKENAHKVEEKVKSAARKVEEKTREVADNVKQTASQVASDAKEKYSEVKTAAKEKFSEVKTAAKEKLSEAKSAAKELGEKIHNKASEVSGNIKDAASKAGEKIHEKTSEIKENVKESAYKTKEFAKQAANHIKDAAKDAYYEAKDKAEKSAKAAKAKLEEVAHKISPKFKATQEKMEEIAQISLDKARKILQDLKDLINGKTHDPTPSPIPETPTDSPLSEDDIDSKVDQYINQIVTRVESLHRHTRDIFDNTIDQAKTHSDEIISSSSIFQISAHNSKNIINNELEKAKTTIESQIPDIILRNIAEGVNGLRTQVKSSVQSAFETTNNENIDCPTATKAEYLEKVRECIPTDAGSDNVKSANNLVKHVEEFMNSVASVPNKVVSCINDYIISGSCFDRLISEIPASTNELKGRLRNDVSEINKNIQEKGNLISQCIDDSKSVLAACAA